MDVMGDKGTLYETGRIARPSDGPSGEAVEAAPDETGEAAEEARLWLAAEGGDTEAASVLGARLLRRGDLDGAEPRLRA
ncbi:sel1 repeat family protein, partial [Streptomyces sp. S6]